MRWQRIDGKVMPALWEILPDIHTLCNIAFPCSAMCFYCAFYFGLLMENGTRGEEMSENMWLWKVRTERDAAAAETWEHFVKKWELVGKAFRWTLIETQTCPHFHVPYYTSHILHWSSLDQSEDDRILEFCSMCHSNCWFSSQVNINVKKNFNLKKSKLYPNFLLKGFPRLPKNFNFRYIEWDLEIYYPRNINTQFQIQKLGC